MGFAHITDCTVPDPFIDQAASFACMALISHLSYNICLFGCFCEHSSFLDRVCQGLLDKHMLAHFYGHHGDYCMCMVRRCDCNGINIFFLFQHNAEVSVFVSLIVHFNMLGLVLVRFQEVGYLHVIDIAHGDNIF